MLTAQGIGPHKAAADISERTHDSDHRAHCVVIVPCNAQRAGGAGAHAVNGPVILVLGDIQPLQCSRHHFMHNEIGIALIGGIQFDFCEALLLTLTLLITWKLSHLEDCIFLQMFCVPISY